VWLLGAAALLLGVAGCAQKRLMPTPNLYHGGSAPAPFAEAAADHQTPSMPFLFATDRVNDAAEGEPDFGYRRSDTLVFGRGRVAVKGVKTWDQLVEVSVNGSRPTLRIEGVELLGSFPPEPPGAVVDEQGMPHPPADYVRFREAASERLGQVLDEALGAGGARELEIYVHGYNNSFEDASYVAAQLGHFTGRRGAAIAYTWPAGIGGWRGYAYDRESSEYTVRHLKVFLEAVADCGAAERVHLISHSRGTDVLSTALRELATEYWIRGENFGRKLRLENLVLAAPDIDWEVFKQRVGPSYLFALPRQMTLYVSPNDEAIGASSYLFRSVSRLGRLSFDSLSTNERIELALMGNLTFIDARVHSGPFSHSYFYAHPAVSSDLILLLRDHARPGVEHGRPLERVFDGYYRLSKDYMLK